MWGRGDGETDGSARGEWSRGSSEGDLEAHRDMEPSGPLRARWGPKIMDQVLMHRVSMCMPMEAESKK